MVRTFKHHEKKLLKKVNFLYYKRENEGREQKVSHLQCSIIVAEALGSAAFGAGTDSCC